MRLIRIRLESATARSAWLDEAGQKKFKLGSWEAILRRLSIHMGRVLITTTPYVLNWLKRQIWDRRREPEIEVVNFRSIDNPAFPLEEYERARRELPPWKFEMFYNGRFSKPAGMIYDNFDETLDTCARFEVPADWARFLVLDFGGVNTAAVFYAKNPENEKYYLYRVYKEGGRTAGQHARALLAGETAVPFCVGGSLSEGQWRREFGAHGLRVRPPAVE